MPYNGAMTATTSSLMVPMGGDLGFRMARISSDTERYGFGVQRQLRAVGRRFSQMGIRYHEADDVHETDESAGTTDRSSYLRTLANITSGRFRWLGLASVSRVSRDIIEIVTELMPALQQFGVKVVTSGGQEYDVTIGAGRRAFVAAGHTAWEELDIMRERATEFQADLADQGRPTGQAPFGYRAEKKLDDDGKPYTVWEIVEAEAEAIRDAVRRLLDGVAFQVIYREWRVTWKTRRAGREHAKDGTLAGRVQSGEWRPFPLRKLLTNPTLAGWRKHRGELIRGTWEAIIDQADHERLVSLFAGRQRDPNARGHLTASIPSPTLRCVLCGAPMSASMTSKRLGGRRRYVCRKQNATGACGRLGIDLAALEDVVGRQIVLWVQHRPEVFAGQLPDHEAALERAVGAAKDELSAHEAQCHPRFGEPGKRMSPEGYEVGHRRLEQELTAATDRLNEHRRADTRTAIWRKLQAENFQVEDWEALTVLERRHIVGEVIERITVKPHGRVHAHWNSERFRELTLGRIDIDFR